MNVSRLLAAGFVCLAFAAQAAPPSAAAGPRVWDRLSIEDEVTWTGEIVLRESVAVGPQGTLRVGPGASVRVEPGKAIAIAVSGRLLVEGTPQAPASFGPIRESGTGPAWEGIRLSGGRAGGHVLAGFRIQGAREGVSLTETSARLSHGTFTGCAAGLRGYQKSAVAADNCLFEGNETGAVVSLGGKGTFRDCRFENVGGAGLAVDKGAVVSVADSTFSRGKTGIFSLTDAPCAIERSAFLSLEKGIVARQMGKDSFVRSCRFENNGTGVLAVQFSSLEVADSTFRGNRIGVDAREFSTPAVRHNRFEGNEVSVNLFRKSHALIEKNVFYHNRNAVVINYSSYPKIAANNFDRNDMSVRLERFQSGDWEEREGSASMAAGEAARRGSRNFPQAAAAGGAFPKRVMARGNYWGPDADRDPVKGTLGKIHDGTKFGPVRYEGFGEKEYRIDVVDFSGEAREPFPDAGPRGRDH